MTVAMFMVATVLELIAAVGYLRALALPRFSSRRNRFAFGMLAVAWVGIAIDIWAALRFAHRTG